MVTRSKKGNTIRVDFTGVEAGGGGRLLPEGTYLFEIKEVEQDTGADSGQPYLKFTLKVAEGDYVGTQAWDNFSLQPQALWKLRGLMETLEMEVIDGEMDIDPKEFIGILVNADILHEEYNGKPKHRVNSYTPVGAESKAEVRTESTPAKKKPAPVESSDWQKGQKVTFMDGKKKVAGKVISVDGKTVTVRAGTDEYEIDGGDLEAE